MRTLLMLSSPILLLLVGCATSDPTTTSCAFEDTSTGTCVVEYVCQDSRAELCGHVISHLRTREHGAVPETTVGAVCDNSPILCTCCDVKAGCYPCPTKVSPVS